METPRNDGIPYVAYDAIVQAACFSLNVESDRASAASVTLVQTTCSDSFTFSLCTGFITCSNPSGVYMYACVCSVIVAVVVCVCVCVCVCGAIYIAAII